MSWNPGQGDGTPGWASSCAWLPSHGTVSYCRDLAWIAAAAIGGAWAIRLAVKEPKRLERAVKRRVEGK